MRRFAIFLSSEKYKHYTDTDYCHADSDNLKNILVERCDYPKENILQLKLSPEAGIEAEGILDEIKTLLDRSEAGDSVLFFYAGHGHAIDGESYLILPGTEKFDAATSSLALRDVHYYLSANQRLNIRIFDCCHSGANMRGADLNMDSSDFVTSILKDGGDGTITFSSCAINEKSYPDEDLRQGVFTSALVQAISFIADDSPVFIESLKLDVCTQVQKWSEERDKKQTPTLTMHVNGNLPIAFTKKSNTLQPKAVSVGNLTFEKRLSNFRGAEVVNEEFYPMLSEAVTSIAQEIQKQGKQFDYYGLDLTAESPAACRSIPSNVEKRIVLSMKERHTMHDMEVVRKRREEIGVHFAIPAIMKPPPEFDVFYYLTQSSEMPDCYVEAVLSKDKVAPASRIFFYVCPLQITVAIITGYYFNIGYNSEKDLKVILQTPVFFSLKAIRNREYLGMVTAVIDSFRGDLHAEVLSRVKILEQEVMRASV